MIISHKYKFIFIKTTKTAGTSIEIALSKFCGPEDIITPISPEDEQTRQSLDCRGPQNYQVNEQFTFYNHMPAVQIKPLMDPAVCESYFKFCVERNPWDRIISFYFWLFRTEPRPSISQFLHSQYMLELKQRGIGLYVIDKKIAINKICRYENLTQNLEVIRKRLNIPEALKLPRAKSQFRKEKTDYRHFFGDKERKQVEKLFSDEIRLFGYEF